ncbi:MAG: hypothetical protein Q8L53_16695 [Aestuariivirga sp.]|nr:hypothetical protein [Aestuariivirga sp.]
MMTNGRGSAGEVIGNSMAAGLQGAQNAGINYKQDALGYQQLDMQMQEQTRKEAEYQEKEKQKAAIMQMISEDTPENQQLAMTNPQAYAELRMKQQFAEPAKPTSDIQNYQFGQGDPNFNNWLTEGKKAGATNVTVGGGKYGTIPPGFELVETPQGAQLRPIPGGPAALEAAAAAEKKLVAETSKGGTGTLVADDIDRAIAALDDPGILPKTGLGAETLKGYGGTGAADLSALLDSVEANTAFEALSAMRAASPTGGALGSITERELALLAATKGSVTQSQSKEQLKYNLNRLWNITQDIVHGPNAGPPRRQLGAGQGGTGKTSTGVPWKVLP